MEKAAQLLYSCGQGYPLARKYAIIVGTLKKYVTRPAVTPSLSDIGTASGIPQHLSPISMLVDGTSHIGSLDAMGQMDLHLPPGGPVPLQLTSESGITLTGPPGPLRIVPPSLSGNLYNAYRLWLPTTLQSPTDSSSTEIPPLPSANQARQEALTRLRPPYTVSDFLSTAGYPQPQQLQQEQLLQQLQPPQLPGSLDVQGIHSFVFPESATDGYLQDVGASGPQMLGGFPPTDSGRRRGLGAMDGVGAGRRGSQQQQQQQVQPGGPPPGAFPVQQQQQQPPPGFPR